MSYNILKQGLMTAIVCAFLAAPAFAQNNTQAMRFLMVNAMMEYGQTLYERGDYDGASTVFNHILTYDHHQAQALEFLKEMGRLPLPAPVPDSIKPQVKSPDAALSIDISDTESLKKAIEAKKQSIERLHAQIAQMRSDLASQSVKE